MQGPGIYGDWDIKARLPHGVQAIRDHLQRVDNVPLLVSLFTDSTPSTIDDMFGIFHDYSESVMCVGSASRATNARLFRHADLAVSMEGLPGMPELSQLPANSPTRLSLPDATFNQDVIGLHCAFTLRQGAGPKGRRRRVSVNLLVDLIREGRRVLCNLYQMVTLAMVLLATAALLVVAGHALPVALDSVLSLPGVLWLLWVVLPALILPLLDTPADAAILTRCPRKNTIKSTELHRAFSYLAARCLPSVLACLYVHTRVLASLLVRYDAHEARVDLVKSCGLSDGPDAWLKLVTCSVVLRPELSDGVASVAAQAEDLTLCVLVLILAVQSAGLMYRTQPVWQENPLRNTAWLAAAGALLGAQALYLVFKAAARGTLGSLLWVSWDTWVVAGLSPFLVLGVGEYVKLKDQRIFNRYQTLLRLEFNTRLGTHSPR
jgi:hypothetical protein